MDAGIVKRGRVLIIDDEESNVLLLTRILELSEFENIASTTASERAVALCAEFEPDIVLLDLQMPCPDGFEVLELLRPWTSGSVRLPILVLTAHSTAEIKRRALASGASDFLSKPFDTTEVVLRAQNLLLTRMLQRELALENRALEQRVRERTRDLEEARLEIIERLALAAEYRLDPTGEHAQRVGHLSAVLALELGLPEETVELIRHAAALHDVGKLGLPDSILLKQGELEPGEREIMKLHVAIGGELLGRSRSNLLQLSEEIALTHHERWDGTGYPAGLKGEQIALSGRIVALADAFDAISRRDRTPLGITEAITELRRHAGRQFDPRVVAALAALPPESLLGEAARAELVA